MKKEKCLNFAMLSCMVIAMLLCSVVTMADDVCPTPATATATVTFKCKSDDGYDPQGFSVFGTIKGDDTIYVYFAKGNLQYTLSTNTWSIMDEQYSIFERINNEWPGVDYVALDTVSLFGWATSNNPGSGTHYQPWDLTTEFTYGNLSTPWGGTEFDYNLSDWGKQFGEGWRTLSIDEWDFIFNQRLTRATITWPRTNPSTGDTIEMVTTQHARWSHAEILTDQTGEEFIDYNIRGMLLIPDDYNGATPEGVYWDGINERSDWSTKCTKAGWEALEAAGCIFLPAPGDRAGRYVTDDGIRGYYWSSTSSSSTHARAMLFNSAYLDTQSNHPRHMGYSVRLVINVE